MCTTLCKNVSRYIERTYIYINTRICICMYMYVYVGWLHEVHLNIWFMCCICLFVCHYILSNCLLCLGVFIYPWFVHELDIYSVAFGRYGDMVATLFVVRVAPEVLHVETR